MDYIYFASLMLWKYIASDVEELYSKTHGGTPYFNLQKAFCAIIYKIRTGVPWRFLPSEFIRHKSSIFRLYKKLCNKGILETLFIRLVRKAIDLGLVKFSWLSMDGTIIQAPVHTKQTESNHFGKNPTDRSRCGTKILFICDKSSIPLGFLVLGANESEVKHIEETIKNMCMNCGERYYSFKGVRHMCMDKAYDSEGARDLLFVLGYQEEIIGRGEEKKLKEEAERKAKGEETKEDKIKEQNRKRFGKVKPYKCTRWSVERLNSWVKGFHDIRTRRAHKAKHFEGALLSALSIIVLRKILATRGIKLEA